MRDTPFDVPTLERIWAILEERCGAGDYWRDNFVQVARGWDYRRWPLEYRFQGALGFGGKVWIQPDRPPTVTCYLEDETPDRRRMIGAANRDLAALHAELNA